MLNNLKRLWTSYSPFTGDVGLPTDKWLEDHTPSMFTQDTWVLERSEYQLVFIYDQMMSNHRMNYILEGHSKLLGSAFTKRNNYMLWKKKLGLGTYPIPLREPHAVSGLMGTPLTARIKGELYRIKSVRIHEALDSFKTNGVEFRRKRVKLLVPYRYQRGNVGVDAEEFLHEVEAWMYEGRKTYWDDTPMYMLGKCKIYELNNRYSDGRLLDRYYAFTPQEHSD